MAAAAAAGNGGSSTSAAFGGDGEKTTIITTTMATANSVGEVDSGYIYFGGGGGGGYRSSGGSSGRQGGLGGGSDGVDIDVGRAVSAPANTGGGMGGLPPSGSVTSGGSGCVILRMPSASYSGTTTGSPVVDSSSIANTTILIFKSSGSYTS